MRASARSVAGGEPGGSGAAHSAARLLMRRHVCRLPAEGGQAAAQGGVRHHRRRRGRRGTTHRPRSAALAGSPARREARAHSWSHVSAPTSADVRIHTDARAAESARSVQSIAYTVGKDIALDSGRYVPHSPQGGVCSRTNWRMSCSSRGAIPSGRGQPVTSLRDPADASIDRTPSVRLSAATSLQRVEQETDTETDQFDVEPEDTFDTLLSRAPLSYHSAKTNKTAKPRNKKPTPEDRVPTATTPSEKALKAIEHARKLKDQDEPAIWFDVGAMIFVTTI